MKYTIHQTKTHFSRLLKESLSGKEVVIAHGQEPIARIVPYRKSAVPRRPRVGTITSEPVKLRDDAFTPLMETELREEWGL